MCVYAHTHVYMGLSLWKKKKVVDDKHLAVKKAQ